MTKIFLKTKINNSIETVFDINRNIDIHKISMLETNEKAIAGTTNGMINLGETVTWRGKHFGIYINHQSIISEMESPNYFVDEQLKGHFKKFRHQHFFIQKENFVEMIDDIEYEVPYWILGKIFVKLFLKKYLSQLIIKRNIFLKDLIEKQ